jgi:peptidoglycan/xylan/chitin deacetylase (PgdA/CDA1 family)
VLNADPVLSQYAGPIFWDEGGSLALDEDGEPLRGADWRCWKEGWTVANCAAGYLREIRDHDGGVVLMHCIHARSAALVNAIVPTLLDEGFAFVRLDDVPGYRQDAKPPPEAYHTIAFVTP